jgi:hypothetical protein
MADMNHGRSLARRNADSEAVRELMTIPGVGKSIAGNLFDIGIRSVSDLRGRDPEQIYRKSNTFAGTVQDRCLLYVFRCAVYFADTPEPRRDPEKLLWWNWKDAGRKRRGRG